MKHASKPYNADSPVRLVWRGIRCGQDSSLALDNVSIAADPAVSSIYPWSGFHSAGTHHDIWARHGIGV